MLENFGNTHSDKKIQSPRADVSEINSHDALSAEQLLHLVIAPGEELFSAQDANRLIDARRGQHVASNLEKFTGLDHSDIANRLIEAGEGHSVASKLEKFTGLDHSDIANRLIDAGRGQHVTFNLNRFTGLNAEIANRLIEAGEGHYVAENLNRFTGLDHSDIANRLIEAGEGHSVASNPEKFTGLDHSDIANRLIDAGGGQHVTFNLNRFTGLNAEIANRLIDAGNGYSVADNLNRFTGLNAEIANRLIDTGNGYFVARNLNKFTDLNHVDIANRLIDAGKGGYIADNLDKFTGLNAEIANRLIDAGKGGYIADNLDKFTDLDYSTCIVASKKDEFDLLTTLLDTEWAPHMILDQVQQILEASEKLQHLVFKLSTIIPGLSLFDQIYIATMLLNQGEVERALEQMTYYPFLADHVRVNPRMAVNLIAKIPQFDETALDHIEYIHSISPKPRTPQNPILAAKLREILPPEMPPPEEKVVEALPHTLDLFEQSFRSRMIDHLRSYKQNPTIYQAFQDSGIDAEKWLLYPDERSFTLGAEVEIPLVSRTIATPLSRLTLETVAQLAETFKRKDGFINSIPADMTVPPELDTKRVDIVEKINKLKADIAATTDERKRAGMEKGLIILEKSLEAYTPSRMRDTLHAAFDALTVQSSGISALKAEQDALLAKDGTRTRQDIATLKQMDTKLVQQITTLIDRFEKTQQMIGAVGERIKVSYDLFATKELFEHFQEDAGAIRNMLASFEKGDSNPLIGREITIGISNRNPYSSLYLGNYTGCCVSIEGPIHGEESPILDYHSDLGMQLVVMSDTTNPDKPLPVAVAWCYIGEDSDGKPVLQIDNIEANTGYTDRHTKEFTTQMKGYMETYAQTLGLRLYQGDQNNDLVVAPLADHDKLGNLYNREDGYYLEAEAGDEWDAFDDGVDDE